jgi:ribokinase
MVKIVVLASFNMDLVMRTERQPSRGETLQGEFATFLGGKGFNQAIAARRLGAEVSAIGRVGDDEFGRRFLDALDREDTERFGVSVDPAAGTGVASIIVDASGENAIVQAPQANRNVMLDDIERARVSFEGAQAALLQLETSDEGAIAFARAARVAGARTILNPAPAARVAPELLELADVLAPNEIEAETITGTRIESIEDAMRVAASLRDAHGCGTIVTLGERGAVVSDGATTAHVPAHRVDAIDTVGAGDAFCAALAVALAEGASLADAAHFANAAGALATRRAGAEPSMPYRAEVEALLKGVRA